MGQFQPHAPQQKQPASFAVGPPAADCHPRPPWWVCGGGILPVPVSYELQWQRQTTPGRAYTQDREPSRHPVIKGELL